MQRHNAPKFAAVLWLEKQKPVPMRRAIMMRLGHAKAIHANICIGERGADARPHALQIGRAIAWRGAAEFGIGRTAAGMGAVKSAGAGEREKLAYIAISARHLLKAGNTHHQFSAANGGVGVGFFHQRLKAKLLAQLINHFQRLQQGGSAGARFAPALHRCIGCIRCGAAVHAV